MKTRMTRLFLACLLFSLLAAAPILHAQEATPEATQVVEDPTNPGAEQAETESAVGDAPITSGEQPGDISSGSSVETPVAPQSGTTSEISEAENTTEEAVVEGAGAAPEAAPAEAPAAQAPGITTLVLLLGLGAVFAVGLLTLARGQSQNGNSDDQSE